MPISLPDMLIPKYRTSQLPMLPLLPLVPKSIKYKNVSSRYMIPSTKLSVRVEKKELNQEWRKIYGS
jgi:hypothetical protein